MARSGVQRSPRLNRLLRRADPEITAELKDAIADMAQDIYDGARSRVPVDTGDLRDAIRVRRGSNGLSAEVGFSKRRFRRAWDKAGWRARFIEFGTRGYEPDTVLKTGEKVARRTTGNSKTTKLIRQRVAARPARPFLYPAYEEAKAEGLPRIREALRKVLARLSEGR